MLDGDTERVTSAEDKAIGPDSIQSKRAWVFVCLVFAGISLGYRGLVYGGLEQSSLMFIGLPTLLAIGLGMTAKPRSATGVILKGSTLFLLLLGILLVEGLICILMASPLVLFVGVIIGYVIDRGKRQKEKKVPWWKDKASCCILGVLAVMSLEGFNEDFSFARNEKIEVSGVWNGSVAEARENLKLLSFDLDELPVFLTLGFPTPRTVEGSGLEIGSVWKIHMAGGEGSPGDIQVVVGESSADRVKFKLIEDASHVSHWLHWQEITWEFEPISEPDVTQVKMIVKYKRLLDPAWYFKPAEQYGVRKAAEYFMGQIYGSDFKLIE